MSACPDCGCEVDVSPLVPCGATPKAPTLRRPIHSGGVECRDGHGLVITHDGETTCEICDGRRTR